MALVTDPATAVAASPPPAPPRRGPNGPRTLVSRFVGYAVLIFFSLVFLYPFVIQISNSFKTEADAADNPLSPIPDPFTTTSMSRIFEGTDFPLWLGNSVLVTVIVTLGRVLLDSMAGYALARLRFAAAAPSSPRSSPSWRCPAWCCSSRSSWCSTRSASTTATRR